VAVTGEVEEKTQSQQAGGWRGLTILGRGGPRRPGRLLNDWGGGASTGKRRIGRNIKTGMDVVLGGGFMHVDTALNRTKFY